jgi:hypothetical protein
MPTVDTQLVDTDVVYADPDDVFRHVRNKDYDDLPTDRSGLSQGGLAQSDVDDLIRQMSERADTFTKRAWRTRKVVDLELRVKFEHAQKHARHRRRKNRRANTYGYEDSSRAFVRLPYNHVKTIDSNEGDSVVVLNERSTNDITDSEGRDDGDYIVSNRKGVLRPDVRLFTPVTTASSGGRDLRNGSASVRVTFRYGFPIDVTDYTTGADSFGDTPLYVSTEVPLDVQDAVGKMVAARLIETDQYGNLVPNAGDDTPNLADAASRLRSTAIANLRDYKRA